MERFDFLVLSFQSSLGERNIFSKKKNIEAVEVKLEDILSCEEILIVRLKSYAINAFVMGYHVYQKNWTPSIGDELQGFMEPTNKLDKYAVAVKGKDRDVIVHLSLGKSGKFAMTVFYFLKSNENHHSKITVTGKATNAGDGFRMKVPSQLFFLAEEKFIIIFQENLCKIFKIYLEI